MTRPKRQNKGTPQPALMAPKGSRLIEVSWLGVAVLVIFTNKQRRKVAKKLALHPQDPLYQSDAGSNGMAVTVYTDDGIPTFIMYLPTDSTLVAIHECTHMVHMLFEAHGIPVESNNTETLAYMTEYLCDRTFMILEERYNKE